MFHIFRTQDGRGFFWRLTANNGEILCHSEVYTTKAAAQDGITAVKRIAPGAGIKDHT